MNAADLETKNTGALDVTVLLATLQALKKGDFTVRMPSDWTGLAGQVAGTLNDIIDTHAGIADALNKAGAAIGREGRLDQRISVPQAAGGWASMVRCVNMLIDDLARLLSEQNIEVERKNREVEQAKMALEEKATQLALSSKYKSEFLANMSHELRTPLNSLLILAQQLADNPEGNLSERQVEFAKTIHGSGSDLLTLINDILDLSRIESGTVTLELGEYRFQALRSDIERSFRHMAQTRGIAFSVQLCEGLPLSLRTDTMRLRQILKNLLSNAFKFTSAGRVALRIGVAASGWSSGHAQLSTAKAVLAFAVTDTGIGIPADKLRLIFEAFQQADGSISRKYGGSGLGLSISRELAHLLGGEIGVESGIGAGSTFTLYLPYNEGALPATGMPGGGTAAGEHVPMPQDAGAEGDTGDDREIVTPGDHAVLIVEEDPALARTLLDHAREHHFKGIVTHRPNSALPLARDYQPSAVLLDIDCAGGDGFAVLDLLKRDPDTRHIPVHAMSNRANGGKALRHGARSWLSKPPRGRQLHEEFVRLLHRPYSSPPRTRQPPHDVIDGKDVPLAGRKVLVVDDDVRSIFALSSALVREDMKVLHAGNGRDGIEILCSNPSIDIMLMDIATSEMAGCDTLRAIRKIPRFQRLPIVALTDKAMKSARDKCIVAGASDYIAKPVDIAKLLTMMRVWLSAIPASGRIFEEGPGQA